jgi:hypothetical protein
VAPFLLRCPRPGGLSPYAARVHPAASAHRTPPAPAIAAAVLALLSAVPAFFALPALALSGGEVGDGGWLVIAVTVVLLVALPVGAYCCSSAGRGWPSQSGDGPGPRRERQSAVLGSRHAVVRLAQPRNDAALASAGPACGRHAPR